MDNNVVQTTTDYDKFTFIDANRELSRGHVEALKRAFEENGNLTRVQPILVNDRLQVIDGQHRFTACKELGQPINYTVVEGLTISDARSINILQKNWTTDDYARSYAATGDRSYQRYIQLKNDFGFNHSVLLAFLLDTSEKTGIYKEFRNGNFVLDPEDEIPAMERLQKLEELSEIAPIVVTKPVARALLRIMRSEAYDQARMARKLKARLPHLAAYTSVEDNLRQLEDIYNHGYADSNKHRLF